MTQVSALQAMLARGQDNALLRFGLGKALLDGCEPGEAVLHLRRCVEQDPNYSAAWKLLGQALLATGERDKAEQAWKTGLATAQARGDKQAEKEMTVFLRRLEKGRG